MIPGGRPASSSAAWTSFHNATFESIASEPPRRMQALPLLIASDARRVEHYQRSGDGWTLRTHSAGASFTVACGVKIEVDPLYRQMLVAAEDARFASHPGVDPFAALRAAAQLAVSGHVVSGASTLTMQVARLLERRDIVSRLIALIETKSTMQRASAR